MSGRKVGGEACVSRPTPPRLTGRCSPVAFSLSRGSRKAGLGDGKLDRIPSRTCLEAKVFGFSSDELDLASMLFDDAFGFRRAGIDNESDQVS